VFSKAIIHYPDDKSEIHKEIAKYLCTAAANYINTLNVSDEKKCELLDSLFCADSDGIDSDANHIPR